MKKEKLIEMMRNKAIHIETETKAEELLNYLYSLGLKWRSGRKSTFWGVWKNNSLYFVENYILYGGLEFPHGEIEIITYEEFKKLIADGYGNLPSPPHPNSVLRCKKRLDWSGEE